MTSDNSQAVASNALFDILITKGEALQTAGMIAITVKPDSGPFYDQSAMDALRAVVPHDCLICFLRPGDSIEALPEDEMRKHGWIKSNPSVLLPPASGGKEQRVVGGPNE